MIENAPQMTGNMEFEKIDILALLPQLPPLVMVDRLLFCDQTVTHTSLMVREENIFVENGVFSQSGVVENVAQTCAARLGYLSMGQPVKIGMIGSINDFEFSGTTVRAGQTIDTEIVVETEVGNVHLLSAKVMCGKTLIAEGKMKVVLTDVEA